jgi:3-phosphoshikimate 1-carboxyvinyltransferase
MQGDSQVAEIFKELGVSTEYQTNGVKLTTIGNSCTMLAYDFVEQPDLVQTVAVTCCLKNIPFHFKGVQSLKIKETDRVAALIQELKKLGYVLTEPKEGELAWTGLTTDINNSCTPIISTYDDHRMAMAFAPVALIQPIKIANPEVVSKSYPGFWEDFSQLS